MFEYHVSTVSTEVPFTVAVVLLTADPVCNISAYSSQVADSEFLLAAKSSNYESFPCKAEWVLFQEGWIVLGGKFTRE